MRPTSDRPANQEHPTNTMTRALPDPTKAPSRLLQLLEGRALWEFGATRVDLAAGCRWRRAATAIRCWCCPGWSRATCRRACCAATCASAATTCTAGSSAATSVCATASRKAIFEAARRRSRSATGRRSASSAGASAACTRACWPSSGRTRSAASSRSAARSPAHRARPTRGASTNGRAARRRTTRSRTQRLRGQLPMPGDVDLQPHRRHRRVADQHRRVERRSPRTSRSSRATSASACNPAVLYAVADRLAQPEGAWKPFDRSGLRALVYPKPARARSRADRR